jgi:CheY-like chemotaxis protein
MHRVLIADDDPILVRRLEKAFEPYQGTIVTATAANGKEAMDVLAAQAVSLLITDVQMPEVDGLELLAHVNRNHPIVRCFVMTAHDSEALQRELPKDLFRFFDKPFNPELVAKAAAGVLGRDIPRGVVRGISVSGFLHMISLEKKSCLLEIRGAENKKGLFFFENGEPFDAVFESLKGEAAAIEIINMSDVTFKFRHFPDRPVGRRIESGIHEMIATAKARQEEMTSIDWDDIISE